MKTNEELQKDVQDAIKWEPLLNAAEIGVIAKDGIITLTGVVDIYAKKLEAETAAKNVAGVKAVVEKIEIKFSSSWNRSDAEIANEVLTILKSNWVIPSEKIKVKVEDGWITMEGELGWNYQKEAARRAINHLDGVKGVTNNIVVKAESHETIEQKEVEKALARNWSLNKQDIKVKAVGHNIILTGTVSSWYQKDEAGKIAWLTKGVDTVDNELVVEYDYAYAD
jgi:osmotically-inducible protein OsmY